MEGLTLRARAITFALSAGAVVFILALLAGAGGAVTPDEFTRALVVAIVCGVMSWGSAERAIAGTAVAVDQVSVRLGAAAQGDLSSPTPEPIHKTLPALGTAMDSMFGQMREQIAHINALARHDPVTGLPNRVHFREQAETLLATLGSEGRAVLLFVDLDRFKTVNDSLGHAFGDALLRIVAERLLAAAAEVCGELGMSGGCASVARLAGDEFTLLVPNSDAAEPLAQRIVQTLAEPFPIGAQSLDVGASVGVAVYPEHGETLSQLMRSADIAMYQAKALGRSRMQVFSAALAARADAREKLDDELREALDRGEFTFAYQPQVNVRSGRIVAVEALLRWRHPSGELRPAQEFIGAADENGLMAAIGGWGIAQAADVLDRWQQAGITQRLAINVAARQLEHPDFFVQLRTAMARRNLPLDLIELEISEAAASGIGYGGPALDGIVALRADGVTVTIDDFGSGYCNLGRLGSLPIDRIKLAPSICAGLGGSEDARGVANALINLLHTHGFSVVATGIESEDQAKVLRVIGCDAMQGYAFAAPMDEAMLLDRLADRRQVVNG